MLSIIDYKRNANQNPMRFPLTPVRMAIINKSTNNKCWSGCEDKGTLLQCCWECKLVKPLWRSVWRYFRKLCMELPYDPAITLLGIYPDKTFFEKQYRKLNEHKNINTGDHEKS